MCLSPLATRHHLLLLHTWKQSRISASRHRQTPDLGMSLRVGIQVSDRCRPESGLRKIVPIHSESVQNITKLRSVSASRPRRTPHLANSVFHVLKKPDSERPRKEEAGQHQGVTLQALAQTHKTPFKHAQHFGRRTP
jgi:hypothetical protein